MFFVSFLVLLDIVNSKIDNELFTLFILISDLVLKIYFFLNFDNVIVSSIDPINTCLFVCNIIIIVNS